LVHADRAASATRDINVEAVGWHRRDQVAVSVIAWAPTETVEVVNVAPLPIGPSRLDVHSSLAEMSPAGRRLADSGSASPQEYQ
jgi:hypothetical protein